MNLLAASRTRLQEMVGLILEKRVLSALQNLGAAPKRCEVVRTNGIFAVNYVDRDASGEMIAAGACSGFANRLSTARAKALSEWVERFAMKKAYQSDASRFSHGSDGCAAYPIILSRRKAKELARINALNEAIERFAWAKWWDDKDMAHECRWLNSSDLPKYWAELNRFVKIESVRVIKPALNPQNKFPQVTLEILIAKTREGGILTGGAASAEQMTQDRHERAQSELLRHAIAYSRKAQVAPTSFYERRLVHFGNGLGTDIVENRLAARGTQSISFPHLAYDSEVDHPLKDLVVVHHCLFEDQPEFMGGDLERLCL